MKHKLTFNALLLLALFLTLAPTALASTTWYVNGTSGSDGRDCKSAQTACKTVHHAIELASSADSIMVAAATYSENLTISKSLKIIGSGASTTIIDGGSAATVVTIPNTSASVILSGMTIRNGAAEIGGGVYSSGILTINNSTVSGNKATESGRCVLSHCTVVVVEGGGIGNSGRLTINNSTVSGNVAQCFFPCASSAGGGIFSGGTLSISNSTISGNSANLGRGINGRATLQNSIVANGVGNCYGTMTSHGYNLSSDTSCNFSNSGDRNNIDPKLGTLGNHGGPTPTIPLLSGSLAIDAGNPSGCTDGSGHLLTTDQRGFPRPDKEDSGGCDMGAYERQSD